MIAGLGNPGPAYANTRHNVGFMVVDEVARRLGVESWKTKDRARQALVRSRDLLLVEPQSFMNESGVPVRLVATWYRIPSQDMLVVYDDMDLPFGRLRMRERGSSGGHNGIRSIISYFGQDFPRLKIGIGRGHDGDAIGRVLGAFSPAEQADLEKVIANSKRQLDNADVIAKMPEKVVETLRTKLAGYEAQLKKNLDALDSE